MPSGIKDWLAGKNPADVKWRGLDRRRNEKPSGVRAKQVSGTTSNHDDSGRTLRQVSLPHAQDDTDAGTKEGKRRDQQRALDRRAAATPTIPDAPRGAGAGAGALSVRVPSEPLPSADDARAGESKQATEGLDDDDDEGLAEGKESADANSSATNHGEEHLANGIARPVAAGIPWLALDDPKYDGSGGSSHYSSMSGGEPVFDLVEVVAEPKNTISDGGVEEIISSWSFATGGFAPMADGDAWEMFEDEEADDDEEAHVVGKCRVFC